MNRVYVQCSQQVSGVALNRAIQDATSRGLVAGYNWGRYSLGGWPEHGPQGRPRGVELPITVVCYAREGGPDA